VERGHRLLFASMLGSFALFGLNMTASGAVLPQVIREFDWSYTTTAVVLYASCFGYFIATFVSGVLIHRLGPRKVIVGGMLVQAVGLGFFGLTSSVWVNAVLKVLSGAGAAGTEVVVNFGVVRMERGGQSRLMNLMHAAFAAGAVASPVIVRLLAEVGATWQTIFRLTGGLSLVMAATMAAMPFSRLDVPVPPGQKRSRFVDVICQPLVVFSSLILMMYVGVEVGVSDWVAEYCVVTLSVTEKDAGMLVSVFWLGLLAGRVGVSALYHGTRQGRLLMAMGGTATAAMSAAVFMPSIWSLSVAIFVAGLGFSAIYPGVMALLGKHIRNGEAMALAMASAGGGAGALVIPFIMAAVADHVGIASGFAFYAAITAGMLALVVAAVAVVRRMEARGE